MIRPGSTKMIAESVPAAEGDGSDDVVLHDGVVGEVAQQRHRITAAGMAVANDQADLEAEVDVGSGEHQRDRPAEQDPADG